MKYDRPKEKPKAKRADVLNYFDTPKRAGMRAEFNASKVSLVGVRGYYANTFGKPNVNDRIYYDDALFLIENIPNGFFASYNFNTDPSIVFRQGLAVLVANEIYDVVKHKHKGRYNALQITKDKLKRDGIAGVTTGRRGINFHYDAEAYSRDSLGCQTLPRSQWLDFLENVYRLMSKHKLNQIKYFLIEN